MRTTVLRQSRQPCNLLRHFSSGPIGLSSTTIKTPNKNVQIFQQSESTSYKRPLLLLFGWLFAKPKNLKKYAELYLQQGFDVITVEIFLRQLLRPNKVQAIMKDVLDLCVHDNRKSQPIFVHCLSVGGYMYGEVLTNIHKDPVKYDDVGRRLRGQIYDSVVDYYGIPGGIARAVTHNKVIGDKIESTLEWYMAKYKHVTADYIKASEAFHDNRYKVSSLFIYSVDDPVCNPDHYELLAAEWRQRGITASSRFWHNAPHVSIFKHHREEYTQAVIDFIRKSGFQKDDKVGGIDAENGKDTSPEVLMTKKRAFKLDMKIHVIT